LVIHTLTGVGPVAAGIRTAKKMSLENSVLKDKERVKQQRKQTTKEIRQPFAGLAGIYRSLGKLAWGKRAPRQRRS